MLEAMSTKSDTLLFFSESAKGGLYAAGSMWTTGILLTS